MQKVLVSLAMAGVVFVVSARAMADYTITTPGNNFNTFVGQNFSPSVGANPDPGLAASDTVFLSSFRFTSTGGAGNPNTRLVILPGAYYDTNGNPNGSFTPHVSDAVAVSTNTVDTDAALQNDALNFTFNNVPMIYGNNYAAVFATVAADNSLSFISVGALYVNYAETPPGSGIFLPTSNYGGTGNFNRTALYADSDGDGFFQADNNAADAAFTASFVVPEPGSLAMIGLFGLAAYRRRH